MDEGPTDDNPKDDGTTGDGPTDDNSATIDVRGAGSIRLRAGVVGPSDGPPVVLLHGGGQTRHSWRRTARLLGDAGWRAYSVDLRGHGDSDWAADGDYSLEAFAADVFEIAVALDRPPALVGASLGGGAARAAGGPPPPAPGAALVLVDVAPRVERAGTDRISEFMRFRLEEGFGSLEEVADAIAAYNPNRPRPKDLSGLAKNVRRRPDGRWRWHWDPRFLIGSPQSEDETRVTVVQPEPLEAAARSLTIPVLLVRGGQSDLLSAEGARRFLEVVPDAELVDVEGAGHMIAGDRNDVFNESIVEFLARRAAPAAAAAPAATTGSAAAPAATAGPEPEPTRVRSPLAAPGVGRPVDGRS